MGCTSRVRLGSNGHARGRPYRLADARRRCGTIALPVRARGHLRRFANLRFAWAISWARDYGRSAHGLARMAGSAAGEVMSTVPANDTPTRVSIE
jgi:hypothetical protein